MKTNILILLTAIVLATGCVSRHKLREAVGHHGGLRVLRIYVTTNLFPAGTSGVVELRQIDPLPNLSGTLSIYVPPVMMVSTNYVIGTEDGTELFITNRL